MYNMCMAAGTVSIAQVQPAGLRSIHPNCISGEAWPQWAQLGQAGPRKDWLAGLLGSRENAFQTPSPGAEHQEACAP